MLPLRAICSWAWISLRTMRTSLWRRWNTGSEASACVGARKTEDRLQEEANEQNGNGRSRDRRGGTLDRGRIAGTSAKQRREGVQGEVRRLSCGGRKRQFARGQGHEGAGLLFRGREEGNGRGND